MASGNIEDPAGTIGMAQNTFRLARGGAPMAAGNGLIATE